MAAGCTKEYYTRQVTEQTIIQQGTIMIMEDATVKAEDWMKKEDHFEALIQCDKITKQVVEEANVQVNMGWTDSAGKAFWTPLPAVHTLMDRDGNPYTLCTDYEWTEGFVSIYVTATDLLIGENPGDLYFRIIIQG